jgi:tetratricopeptide (TPR) repeat protein
VLALSSIALGLVLAKSNSLKILSDENALKATESASLARVERDRSREALQAMTSDVATQWLGAQRELTSEQTAFLQNTVSYYQAFAAGNTDTPEDQFWVAQAEHRLAQLFSRLGQFDDALSSANHAITLLETMPVDWEPAKVAMELADALHDKDASLAAKGKIADALPVAKRAVEVIRQLLAEDPDDLSARKLLAEVTGNLGSRFQQLRQFDQSLAAKTESVLIGEQLLLEQPDDVGLKRSLGIKSMNLAILLVNMNRYVDAQERFGQSLQIRNELVEREPDSAIYQFDLAFVLHNMAGLEFRSHQPQQAESLAHRSADISRKLVQQYPLVEQYRRHLILSLGNRSAILNVLRKFDESKIVIEEMNSLAEQSIRNFPDVPLYRLMLANGSSSLASALAEQGLHQEAIQFHDTAIAQLREMIDQSIESSRATQMLESALYGRATALGYVDRHDDAIADWDALIKITRPNEVNTIWLCRATSLVKKGEVDSALADVERVLGETRELPEDQRDFRPFYNSACVYSLLSARVEDEDKSREHALRAIELLQQAIDAGLSPLANVRADPELEPLHAYPEYQAIVKE